MFQFNFINFNLSTKTSTKILNFGIYIWHQSQQIFETSVFALKCMIFYVNIYNSNSKDPISFEIRVFVIEKSKGKLIWNLKFEVWNFWNIVITSK